MKLVAGLGNPGKKYEGTRHNVGFEVVESLAGELANTTGRLKFDGFLQEGSVGAEKFLLLMPQTFMNLSGRSIQQTMDFYRIPMADLLVVCDDFHLPLGTLRMRAAGSAGGQKGLADTIHHLKTDQFARLRLGIGPVPDHWDPANFVLGRFAENEREEVHRQIKRAHQAVESWILEGIARAMSQFNGGPSEAI